MAKKRRIRKPQRPARAKGASVERRGNPELIEVLRRGLRSDEPLELLSVTAALLDATDPRHRNPLSSDESGTTREELLESLIGMPFAETTAALTVMRVLIDDELTKARITRELANRRHPMPPWLTSLQAASADPAVLLVSHVLKDGDNYLFGVRLPTGQSLSALVYVDTNMGVAVKDAFITPETVDELADRLLDLIHDPDQSITQVNPANGRVEVAQAIALSAMFLPPVETDTWPMCRPLVEWMLGLQPAGGKEQEPTEWSQEQTAEIAEAFFNSEFGRPIDSDDARDLLESILWFATWYTGGDPYRWSSVRVEVLLADWFPRKIVAPTAHLALMPDVLRAYVRYCHDRQGIRDSLTRQTLAAIDDWEPEYQQLIRSERDQGAVALAAAAMEVFDEPDGVSLEELVLTRLAHQVGGRVRLQELSDAPLPDEPFEWAGIPDDIHAVVNEMLDACDRFAADLENIEYRTAMRRFLSRAAAGDPSTFRRKGSTVRGAAAVAWVIAQANGMFSGKFVLDSFGLKTSVSERARPMLRAVGVDPEDFRFDPCSLGSPGLLLSEVRRDIIRRRDQAMARLES